MIYVINLTFYNKDTKEIIDLVKIGYTADNNKKRRYNNYQSHSPIFNILYEVDNGNELDEKVLHKHFSSLIYSGYGKEWFHYDQVIIDFFEHYKKIDEIREVLKDKYENLSNSCSFPELHKELKYFVNRWLIIESGEDRDKLRESMETYDKVVKDAERFLCGTIKTRQDIIDYLKRLYSISDDIIGQIYKVDVNIPKHVIEFLNSVENEKSFYDKMKMLCESGLSESDMGFILDQIPIIYKNYYLTLGPERCRANGYNITEVKKEYNDLKLDKSDLEAMIYSNFEVGKRYLMLAAKEKIKEIYEKVGYNKSPKATDLENYFETKRCNITIEGKRIPGFEIIKKK